MNHDQLLNQAERMRNTLRDWLDQPSHAQARTVEQSVERLIGDIRSKKPREALDANLRNIVDALRRVEEEVMDFHHSNQLISMCENLRNQASRL